MPLEKWLTSRQAAKDSVLEPTSGKIMPFVRGAGQLGDNFTRQATGSEQADDLSDSFLRERLRILHRIDAIQHMELVHAEAVIRQYIDRHAWPQRTDEFRYCPDVLVRVTGMWNQRHSHDHFLAAGGDPPRILEDQLVRHPGCILVQPVVDHLDVVQEQIRALKNLFQRLPRTVSAGIQRGMNASFLALLEQRSNENRLLQRLAARAGDTAT